MKIAVDKLLPFPDSSPCMVIDVSLQHNGGFLPDNIILMTLCYYNREI